MVPLKEPKAPEKPSAVFEASAAAVRGVVVRRREALGIEAVPEQRKFTVPLKGPCKIP